MKIQLNEKIKAKQAEITDYERILREYGSGRWLDMGRRHLAELNAELKSLENQLAESELHTTPSTF